MLLKVREYVESQKKVHARGVEPAGKRGELNTQEV